MSKRLSGIIGCKDKTSPWHLNGFPMVLTLGQQYNIGEKPTVILPCRETRQTIKKTFLVHNTQFRTRVFVFQFFSVQGGNSTDVKIHSSEVKMYSADVKIQVKIRSQKIAIRCDVAYKVAVIGG